MRISTTLTFKTFSNPPEIIGWFSNQVRERLGGDQALEFAADLKIEAILLLLFRKGITDENEFLRAHNDLLRYWASKIQKMPPLPENKKSPEKQ